MLARFFLIWIGLGLHLSLGGQSRGLVNLSLNEFNQLCSGEKDKIVLINFWASWCGPCMEELHYFKKLKQEHPSARIILINLDFEREVNTHVQPILIKGGYGSCENYTLNGLAADDWMPLVDREWSGAIPATLVLAGGKKKFVEQKFENYNALKTTLIQF